MNKLPRRLEDKVETLCVKAQVFSTRENLKQHRDEFVEYINKLKSQYDVRFYEDIISDWRHNDGYRYRRK